MDLNLQTIEIVSKCIGFNFKSQKTVEYFHEVADCYDFRHLVDGKKDSNTFDNYTQVFGEKHGYINNLSILDLLFNEGRFALDYLKKQKLFEAENN